MLIVGSDPERVETDLAAGVGGVPVVWRGAWAVGVRPAASRCGARPDPVVLRPRRARCRSCRSTHVLLPDVVLARRVDTVAVIGRRLVADGRGGAGHRTDRRAGGPAGRRRCGGGCVASGPSRRGWRRSFHGVGARAWTRCSAPSCRPARGGRRGGGDRRGGPGRVVATGASPAVVVGVGADGRAGCSSNTNSPWLAP